MEKKIFLIPVNKTIEIGDICKSKITARIVIATLSFINAMKNAFDMSWMSQQLIIVSNEKIRANDWYLYDLSDVTGKENDFELMQCRDEEEADRCNTHSMIAPSCSKIIAAYPKLEGVPKISDTFINNWVEKPVYNVDVEYIKTDDEFSELKITPDNEIVCLPKDRYSKFENTSLFPNNVKNCSNGDCDCCDDCDEKETKRILDRAKLSAEANTDLDKAVKLFILDNMYNYPNEDLLLSQSNCVDLVKSDVSKKYWFEQFKTLFTDIMNLGMKTRQDQLNGYGIDKSGNDILKDFLDNYKKQK